MEAFTRLDGLVAPLERANVDTDQIIPKQFLKRIGRTGFGEFLFYDWRYGADGAPDPSFVLNMPEFKDASVLVAGRNFGCGSSREHAPWALREFGFRVIIAPSFADIFRNNCLRNGLLLVELDDESVTHMQQAAKEGIGYRVTVDLEKLQVTDRSGLCARFTMDSFWRRCLMEGVDEIGNTLRHAADISEFEARRPAWMPVVAKEA